MKLFTKEINDKLFEQYPKGGNLAEQMVVAKLFNPYGRGTWYLVNSDPSEPDYIWAIVHLMDVEVGSVSRAELTNLRVPPFNLPLERDMSFRPTNAEELLKGLRTGKHYDHGGSLERESKEMLENQAIQLQHHTEELMDVLKNAKEIEPWVIAKAERATTDLADITHYLDGRSKITDEDEIDAFDLGGEIKRALGDSVYDSKEMLENGLKFMTKDVGRHFMILSKEESGKWLLTPTRRAKQFLNAGWKFFGYPILGKAYKSKYAGEDILKARRGIDLGASFEKFKSMQDDNSSNKSPVAIARGTDYTVALELPNRIEFYKKMDGKQTAMGSILVAEQDGKWVVKERKYSDEKGGYYDELAQGLSKEDALDFVYKMFRAKEGGGKTSKNYVLKNNKPINSKYNYALLQINKNGDVLLMGTYSKLETAESQKSFWEKNYAYPNEVEKFVVDELIDKKEDGGYMEEGGATSSPNNKFMKWYGDWSKDVKEKVFVSISIPNEFSSPIKDAKGKIVILDVIEKKGDSDAKKYMNEILKKADEFGVSIYLEPIPRTHNLKSEEHKKKITTDYLIKYYEKFGFENTVGGFMVREPKMADGGWIEDVTREMNELKKKYPKSKVSYFFAKNPNGKNYVIEVKDENKVLYTTYDDKKMEGGGMTDPMATVNEISRLSGLSPIAVAEWGDKNNVNLSILLKDLKSKKIKGMDLMTAIVGNPNNKYQKELLAKYSRTKMAMGGPTKFEDKVAAIKASLLKRKKVAPKVQKDYGKTYSPAEAEDSAKRIVGAMTAKERLEKILKKKKKSKK